MADEVTTTPNTETVEVTIDGKVVRVPQGTLLLDAATAAGIHIPVYCAHPKMEPVAVCRMCLVQVEKAPKLQPACATYVAEGMVAHTAVGDVTKAREGVLEFLLLNHPLDCPVCDRGGECDLQDFATRYGPETSRFPITQKVHKKKAVVLSDKIELDQERCVLCWRCTRYYDEITGEKELVLQQRGVHTVIDSFNGQPLQSDFQGNLPEVCPVGALTHRQYRFKARPWDLQRTKSVCPECSYGCNINVDTRDFEIKRFASRDNPAVDDMWLCDRGRYSAPQWNSTDRIRRAAVRRDGALEEVPTEDAVMQAGVLLQETKTQHGPGAIGVIASAQCTNEELWLLQRLAREVLETPNLDHQLMLMDGLRSEEHQLGIAQIEECSAVVVLGEEPEQQAPVLTLRLHKAATKRHVMVHRVGQDVAESDIKKLVQGQRLVGVIADETNRAHAAAIAKGVASVAQQVLQLTITRGVNGRGAKDLGVLSNLLPGYHPAKPAGKNGMAMLEAAAAGVIHTLLLVHAQTVINEAPELFATAVKRGVQIIAIETAIGSISQAATVLIPGHSYMEKSGTVTNVEGRVQRLRPALPPVTNSPHELRVLSLLAAALGATDWAVGDALTVHQQIAAALPAYAAAGNGERAVWKAPA